MNTELEPQDYDLMTQEQREEQDREIYKDQLQEFQNAMNDIIETAKNDEITLDDIIEATQNTFFDLFDEIISIKKVNI